jgi:putative ABC transport system permease protein
LSRNKGFTIINLLGLTIGLASCILIALYVNHEIGVDRFHKNSRSVYRLYIDDYRANVFNGRFAITSPKMGEDIRDAIPEVKQILRIGGLGGDLKYIEKSIPSGQLLYADSTLWDFFDFPLVSGNPKQALADPFTIVLSQKLAESLFGSEDPMGKSITLNGNTSLTVTGVVVDRPSNTRFDYTGFVSFSTLYRVKGGTMTAWDGNFSFRTFLMLANNNSINLVTGKINEIADEAINKKYAQFNLKYVMGLQNIRDVHLFTDMKYEKPGVAKVLYVVSGIALIILFIAGFNFVNLTTARSTRRAKEVGLRMAVGSSRFGIRSQFLGESVLLSFISGLISLIVVELLMPWYNNFLGINLNLYSPQAIHILVLLPFFIILFGLVAGIYPAYFLSSFNPIRVIKSDFAGVRTKPVIRNILVTAQFVISSLLIIVTIVTIEQLHFLKSKDLGINTTNLVVTSVKGDDMWARAQRLKQAIVSFPEVESVGIATDVPGTDFTQNGFKAEGVDDPVMIRSLGVDYDFLNTLGSTIIDGRNLSDQFGTDSTAVVINEALVRKLGWENPIGKKLKREKDFVVVGVVKDFHYKSLHSEIEPLVMFLTFDYYYRSWPHLHVRFKDGLTGVGLKKVQDLWEKTEVTSEFTYKFIIDIFNQQYKTEENFSKLFSYFALIAIFISCLGLLGLSSFMLENKLREIGIRKVLGSETGTLVTRFAVGFTRWAILGAVISWPIAYYALTQILQLYAYRIDIPWLVFAFSAFAMLIISVATILVQTYKAAKTNPVEILKYE